MDAANGDQVNDEGTEHDAATAESVATASVSQRRRRLSWKAMTLVGILVLLAVTSVAAVVIERRRNVVTSVPHHIITPDGPSFYTFRKKRSTITVTAQPAKAINIRTVFWPSSAKPSVNQESCITWTTPDGRAQPGMAMRFVPGSGNTGKTLLLTQDVYGHIYSMFFVLGFDNGVWDPPLDKKPLGQFDMVKAVSAGKTLRPGPWYVCTRVVGRTFSLKIWFPGQAEPSWQSTGPQVRHTILPAKWVYAGLPASYIGHIRAGERFVFKDQHTRSLD